MQLEREKVLPSDWMEHLRSEFERDSMKALSTFLKSELEKGKRVYPQGKDIFNAFKFTPFSQVKVVILGQDPYHGPNQAHGICFSVKKGVRTPPSLLNIFKEIQRDLKIPLPAHGELTAWALQGVLLLNTVLTVEEGKAGSHQNRGWETFTDKVMDVLSLKKNLVYLLWGSHAQKKAARVDAKNNLVLFAPHPSPLSAHRGFLGCGHFSACNEYLRKTGQVPIDWAIV